MGDGATCEVDVIVVGSGFGGSVAALRFAEAGHRVVVLERGDWVLRESHEPDADALWKPHRQLFGMHDFRARGRNVIPWLGSCVGGGSHVYAATLKRLLSLDGFPAAVREEGLDEFYDVAECVLDAQRYPDWAPYGQVRSTQLLYRAGDRLKETHPELVEEWGAINLGISFAPEGGQPGAPFTNKHGARQRYQDPQAPDLLGGDIGATNSLDLNYLFLAQKEGAEVRALCEADRIEPLEGGGYRVHYVRRTPFPGRLRRHLARWLPFLAAPVESTESLCAQRVVLAAGSIGTTELLLRNRDVHGTLAGLGDALGRGYSSNGDYVTLMQPFKGFYLSWAGLIVAAGAAVLGAWWIAAAGALAYAVGLLVSRRAFDPDIGATNSDYIRFVARDGSPQGVYVEGGRYPTPLRAGLAIALSVVGLWRPGRYKRIVALTNFLRRWVPPFELIGRSWPIPLLQMGRDAARGTFALDEAGRAEIDFELEANDDYYEYLGELGRLTSDAVGARWFPNFVARTLRKVEVPHNLGGAHMADGPADGVVDHAGRVFGYRDLLVLDGSVIPRALGPNPALTIAALAERAMRHVLDQIEREGSARADPR
ncbi:MAG: GMC oxidoreductase [Gemmatimonadota bacterium]